MKKVIAVIALFAAYTVGYVRGQEFRPKAVDRRVH